MSESKDSREAAGRKSPLSLRIPEELDHRLRAHVAMTGESINGLSIRAIERELEGGEAIAAAELIDGQLGDFEQVSIEVVPGDGCDSVRVVDVKMRTTDPVGRALPPVPTSRPITDFVAFNVRREKGQVVVEVTGRPGERGAAARILVGAVPIGVRAVLRVWIADLHPLSRPDNGPTGE